MAVAGQSLHFLKTGLQEHRFYHRCFIMEAKSTKLAKAYVDNRADTTEPTQQKFDSEQ